MIFFSQTQFSFKLSLNVLWTDLITAKYCCQNLQQAFISERDTIPLYPAFQNTDQACVTKFGSCPYLHVQRVLNVKTNKRKKLMFFYTSAKDIFPQSLSTFSSKRKGLSPLIHTIFIPYYSTTTTPTSHYLRERGRPWFSIKSLHESLQYFLAFQLHWLIMIKIWLI